MMGYDRLRGAISINVYHIITAAGIWSARVSSHLEFGLVCRAHS